jgi:two-component system, chemotaxis family, chemotaxis protein CheY
LKNSLNGDWIGWAIEVRNADGTKCYSLPITLSPLDTTNANVEPNQSTKDRPSLLIIDDVLIHSAAIGRIAAKVGFNITRAHSYEDACRVLDERQFDCITLDLGLGEHVGVDVLRYLSTVRYWAGIIVISESDKDFCDGVAELGSALDLNVCASVPKPIDIRMLQETLGRIKVQSLRQKPALPPV